MDCIPKLSDPDFFSPRSYAHVEITGKPGNFQVQAVRGPHKGPVLLTSPTLAGLTAQAAALGWEHDSITQKTLIPIEELPAITVPTVAASLQRASALAIPDFKTKLCQAYYYQDPEDQVPIHEAFAKVSEKGPDAYGGIDSLVGNLKLKKIQQFFTPTEVCMLEHSSIFCKGHEFEMAMASMLAPKLIEKIRLSAWHNHAGSLTWDQMAEIYNSLRSFSVGLPDFTVGVDHTTGCNPKGYTSYFSQPQEKGERRIYADAELSYFISYKGEPVLIISFHVVKGHKQLKPVIAIKQIQMLKKSGNRWLYKLPCHYMEYFLIRMKLAFLNTDIHLIKGDALAKEITANYANVLKRSEERIEKGNFFSETGRADEEKEVEALRQKIQHMEAEVTARLTRNYAYPSKKYHLFTRQSRGDFWRLKFKGANMAQAMAA